MVETNESRDDISDSQAEAHHIQHDPASGLRASELLISAVADISDTDPLELEPLYEAVDPDMLDDFVKPGSYPDIGGLVSFVFGGYNIQVHPSGLFEIEVHE